MGYHYAGAANRPVGLRGLVRWLEQHCPGVLELKVDFGPGYRVYFGKDGERLVILLGGSAKKTARRRDFDR